jgi:flavodoxin
VDLAGSAELASLADSFNRMQGALKAKEEELAANFHTLAQAHDELKKYLGDKGFMVVGEWYCLGFDTYGFYKLLGGINKGRPNERDIEAAKDFARGLIKKPKPV